MVTLLLDRWRSGALDRNAALEVGVQNVLQLIDGALERSSNKGVTR